VRRRGDQPQAGRAAGQPARPAVRPSCTTRRRRSRPGRTCAGGADRTLGLHPDRRPAAPARPLQGRGELTPPSGSGEGGVLPTREPIRPPTPRAEAQTRSTRRSPASPRDGDVGMAISAPRTRPPDAARAGAIDELLASVRGRARFSWAGQARTSALELEQMASGVRRRLRAGAAQGSAVRRRPPKQLETRATAAATEQPASTSSRRRAERKSGMIVRINGRGPWSRRRPAARSRAGARLETALEAGHEEDFVPPWQRCSPRSGPAGRM
jgi:hypothetical protein